MMVGASRSGKTSILASMLKSYRDNINLFNELPIVDNTAYDETQHEVIDKKRLDNQASEMIDMLKEKDGGCANMTGLLGTQGVTEYSFEIDTKPMNLDKMYKGLPKIKLTVMDIPGENFQADNNKIAYSKITEKDARQCQVLIVAVDVPSMMYASAMGKDDYKQKINCNDAVLDLISNLGNNIGEKSPRLLIFVPIKCEYWAKGIDGHTMDEVYEEVEKVYMTQIELFKRLSRSKILIMPLETIGGLVFDHHSPKNKMKILLYSNQKEVIGSDKYELDGYMSSRCEKDYDDIVILPNGSYYELEEGDKMMDVPQKTPYAYSPERPIPYTWYKAYGDIGYSPKNCDQLFLHLLKFSVQCAALNSNYAIKDLITKDFGLFASIAIGLFGGYVDSRQVKPLCIRLNNMIKNGHMRNDYKVIHNSFDADNPKLSF